MKKIFTICNNRLILKTLFTVFILINASRSDAAIDTLRYYNPATGYANAGVQPLNIAKFPLPRPGYIKSLVVTLGGSSTTNSVTVHIYGNEGGTDAPVMGKDLITPIVVNKTATGIKRIEVTLPTPLYVANTQFAVAITDVGTGITILTKAAVNAPFCSSETGGEYYYQFVKDNTGTFYLDETRAYAIDVIIDYDYAVSPSYYQDVTLQAGIDTAIASRSIAWGDFNKDGYEDFIATGRLYKNNANGTFTDITSSSGINIGAAMNAFMDMNNDGWLDILIIGDYNKNVIFINNGNETFTAHDLTGMPVDSTTTSFSIADFNKDKFPDLFLGQLWKDYPNPLPNYLFTNDHSLGFTNVSTLLYPGDGSGDLLTYACMFMDYDNDGDADLYVSNYYLERDELWQNNGNGTFTNIIDDKGIDLNSLGGSGHGTGVDWADYDNDGDMDLLLPQLAHPQFMQQYDHRSTTIYRNEGAPGFDFTDLIGQQLSNPGLAGQGLEYEETQAGGEWADINNDGLQDIFLTAYYGCRYVKLYLQKPDHTFEIKTFDFGLQSLVHASDAVFADYDNDGKLDLAAGEENSHFRLFKNTGPFYGNYLEIDLKSTSQNDYAIGGRVTVYAGGNKYMRDVNIGQGEGMQKPYRLHFGLGQASTIDSVTVRWPNHTATEKFSNINVNGMYTLTEGGQVVQGVKDLKSESAETISAAPNPFSNEVTLNYNLNNAGDVKVEIFSLVGQKVKTLVDVHQSAGSYKLQWNAKDDSGNRLPSGFYMVYLKLHDSVITKKIIKVAE